MKLMKKIGLGWILGLIFIVALLFGFVAIVRANPLLLGQSAKNSVSTTTPSFMTLGTATTTVIYDSYEVNGSNQTNNGNTILPDSAVMLIQFTASSTTSILGWKFEYATGDQGVNCRTNPTGCEWYSDTLFSNTNATTSQTFDVTPITAYTWKFASTTQSCTTTEDLTSVNRACKIVNVPTPLRYVRAVFYITSAQSGAVRAEIIPKKQKAE